MAGIADIVSVSITVQDSAPKAVAFDTPLILAKAPYSGQARQYGINPAGLAAMVTDGFPIWSRAYQMMSAMSAQAGGAGSAYIFGRSTNNTQSLDLVPDISVTSVGYNIAFNISYKGVTAPIAVTVATNTVDAICDALQTAIGAASISGLTVTPDNGTATKLTLTTDGAGQFVQLDGFTREIKLNEAGADGSTAAQLATAKSVLGEGAYGLLLDSYAKTEIEALAAVVEGDEMLFLAQSADNDVLTSSTSDVASSLKTSGYNRSAAAVSRYMSSCLAAGELGRQLGQVPGSSNWAMQTLAGVSADVFTDTAHAFARGKNALTYTTDRGVAHTWDGKAASGRYFDIQHGVDALKADIETRVYQVLLNAEKVPFTATGLSMIESAIRAALTAAEGTASNPGLVAPGWTVTMPSLTGYSSVDKAARILRTITFSAVMTGAIDSVTIAGTLTL